MGAVINSDQVVEVNIEADINESKKMYIQV